jgi:hypothetical protein
VAVVDSARRAGSHRCCSVAMCRPPLELPSAGALVAGAVIAPRLLAAAVGHPASSSVLIRFRSSRWPGASPAP